MKLYILSDLHIHSAGDPLYHALLRVFREKVLCGDVVVLAGDIFDLFIGEKEKFARDFREFVEALRDAGARGAYVHYVEGNHDFLLRRAFSGMNRVFVHTHEVSFELEGKKFYVAHGDLVDREDYSYRFLRTVFRSLALKAVVQLLPEKAVELIGTKSSRYSREQQPVFFDDLPPAKQRRLRQLFRNFAAERVMAGFDYVILGHCHDRDEMEFVVGERKGHYFNVGYPRVHGSFLVWSPGMPAITRESFN